MHCCFGNILYKSDLGSRLEPSAAITLCITLFHALVFLLSLCFLLFCIYLFLCTVILSVTVLRSSLVFRKMAINKVIIWYISSFLLRSLFFPFHISCFPFCLSSSFRLHFLLVFLPPVLIVCPPSLDSPASRCQSPRWVRVSPPLCASLCLRPKCQTIHKSTYSSWSVIMACFHCLYHVPRQTCAIKLLPNFCVEYQSKQNYYYRTFQLKVWKWCCILQVLLRKKRKNVSIKMFA